MQTIARRRRGSSTWHAPPSAPTSSAARWTSWRSTALDSARGMAERARCRAFDLGPATSSWVTSANLGMTAALAETLGPFDTRFVGAGDDIAVSWRLTLLGTPPTAVPDAVMHYRLRPAGLPAWRHQYLYAKRMVTLYREFAPMGMPRREWKEAWGSWRYTLIRSALAPLLPPAQRQSALRELGLQRRQGSRQRRGTNALPVTAARSIS